MITVRGHVVATSDEALAGLRVCALFRYRLHKLVRPLVRVTAEPGSEEVAAGNGRPGPGLLIDEDAPGRPGYRIADVGDDGTFAIRLVDRQLLADDTITLRVVDPAGVALVERAYLPEQLRNPVELGLGDETAGPIDVAPEDALPAEQRIQGRVFDLRGEQPPGELQVVVEVATQAEASLTPVCVTTTNSGGYFTATSSLTPVARAAVSVGGTAPVPVQPVDGALPNPLLVGVDLRRVLRLTDPSDLSPATGLGLTAPNRAIEEFDYYTLVRTTEPEITSICLNDSDGTSAWRELTNVFRAIRTILPSTTVCADGRPLDDRLLMVLLLTNGPAIVKAVLPPAAPAEAAAIIDRALAYESKAQLVERQLAIIQSQPTRMPVDYANPMDWDSTPTLYLASTIAHGHLLHFKQVWYADGYSLGDLLYSLPLAPGQKRTVSIVDWRRRDEGARTEETRYGESLTAALNRDRDVFEVVNGTLRELTQGGSASATAGFGTGSGGAGNGSYYGFNFGALFGISGGFGGSAAIAWQDSARTLGATSLQQLRDGTLQSASAVRGLRTTTVKAVTQGEAVVGSTETVANHNRCHAMTVEYFEVLRHLRVVTELADARECLLVPLPISPFDRQKALRWREPLLRYLRRRELQRGFDAAERVQTSWLNLPTPTGAYADEHMLTVEGELTLVVSVPLPPLPMVPTRTPEGQIKREETETGARIASAFLSAGGSEVLRLLGGDEPVRIAETMIQLSTEAQRYRWFHREVMPRVVAKMIDRLRLHLVHKDGASQYVRADFTQVSAYSAGAPMVVGLTADLSGLAIDRASVRAVRIAADPAMWLPEGCGIIVRDAALTYRTDTFQHSLFRFRRVNQDIDITYATATVDDTHWPPAHFKLVPLADQHVGPGVTLQTPTDPWERLKPRDEDKRLSDTLIRHLNDNLEYYHQAIWWAMDPARRYLLLDGHRAPHANGRSVASVVQNQLIGIAGNSLVMPVSPGSKLDPKFGSATQQELAVHYRPDTPASPARVSLPTGGVFAEAVLGTSNSAEVIDESRLWRWEETPADEAPALESGALASRRADLAGLTPTAFPTPMISIQNAPSAPEAPGVDAVLEALGKSSFTDITGLAATQQAAASAVREAIASALSYGKEASALAQAAGLKSLDKVTAAVDRAEANGTLAPADAQELRKDALRAAVSGDRAQQVRTAEEQVRLIDKAAEQGSIDKTDATALNKRALEQLVVPQAGGRTDQDAAAEKIKGMDPDSVTSVRVTGPGGASTRVATRGVRAARRGLKLPPLSPQQGGRSILPAALQTGDIIVSTVDDGINPSLAIRLGTRSPVSHAALYVGNSNKVIEAIVDGVVERDIDTVLAGDTLAVAFRVPGLSPGAAQLVANYASTKVGKRYDLWEAILAGALYRFEVETVEGGYDQAEQLAKYLRRVDLGTAHNRYYCSQLVFEAFQAAGHPLSTIRPDASVPGEIPALAVLYVGHLKY